MTASGLCKDRIEPRPHSAFRKRHAPAAVALATLALSALPVLAEPSIQVSVNRNEIFLGETILLEVRLGGESDPAAPDVSGIRNASVHALGSRSEQRMFTAWVNGQMKTERFKGRVFQYEVMPAAAGELRIGPISATVDNRPLRDDGPTVRVVGVEEQNLVKVSIEASRSAVLVDEPFTITLVVCLRQIPGQWSSYEPMAPQSPPRLDIPYLDNQPMQGLTAPDAHSVLKGRVVRGNTPGFAINNFTVERDLFSLPFFGGGDPFREPARFQLDRKTVTRDDNPYNEYRLSITYRPRKEASHTFGPVIFKGDVIASVSREGKPMTRTVYAVGPAAVVRVVPPPEEGRPASFVGVVGSNLAVRASLDAQTCNVGDPLTLTLAISGQANVESAFPPDLSALSDLSRRFRVYMDTTKSETRDGVRYFTYMIRPTLAGTLELPAIPVSYYDVGSRAYRTASTDPLPVRVNEATVLATSSIIIEGKTNESPVATASHLPVAPMDVSTLGWATAAPWFPPWTRATAAGSLAVFLLALAARPMGRAARRLVGRNHRAGALSRARTELQAASSLPPAETADRATAASRAFCRDRFGLSEAPTLTQAELAQALLATGLDAASVARLKAQLETLAAIRFGAMAAPDGGMSGMMAELERTLRELDGSRA